MTTTGEDKESGIGTIYYSKDNGKTWENAGAGKTYTFKKLKTGSYQLKARVVNGAGLETASNVVSATTNDIIPPTYAVDKTGWQPKKVVTITYPAREEDFVYQYSLDGGKSWKEVASPETKQQITFTANGTVIARITDGVNYKTASSFAVTQIDTTPPTSVIAMGGRTSNSITLKATCTDDKSGISKIEYSKDNGKTYVDGGTNTTYTFTGLKTGTYNFKVRCTNGSGMTATSTAVSGSTNSIGTPTYAVDKTGWQTKKVVTITYPARQSNFTYQYSLDGGRSWTTVASPATTKQVTFTANGTIIARITDGTNYVTASSFSVTQIDTSAPSATVAVSSTTYNSATLKATCTDAQSGITKVEFSKDNGASYVANGTNTTYTFGSLATGTYNFRARCTNGVGLQTQSATVSKAIYNQFTVTFNANGGTTPTSSKKVTVGSTYGTLPTPTRTGHKFAGWFTAQTGGTQVTSSTTVNITANQTLYAHWTKNNYTLTFNAAGGSVSPTSRSVAYGAAYGTLPTPSRTNYKFLGWYTAASGGTQVSASTTMGASNVTIYAHWQLNTVNVTFNANGGSGTTTKAYTVNSTLGSLPSASRSGYTFKGWYTSNGGGSKVSSSTKVTKAVTYYARWWRKEVCSTSGVNNFGYKMRLCVTQNGQKSVSVNADMYVGNYTASGTGNYRFYISGGSDTGWKSHSYTFAYSGSNRWYDWRTQTLSYNTAGQSVSIYGGIQANNPVYFGNNLSRTMTYQTGK